MKQRDFDVSAQILADLLHAQFPHWADLDITSVPSSGTDNSSWRLGNALVARLPRSPASVPALLKEQMWLPRLEEALPISVPHLVGRGQRSTHYPAPWSINTWIVGEVYREDDVADWDAFVQSLAAFIQALQRVDASNAPPPGEHNFGRGAPLAAREERVRAALHATATWIDAKTVLAAWQEDSQAAVWSGAPCWLHGDIHPENILLADGRLHAIIDFGCLGAGDPACELALAWRLLPRHARQRFRAALAPDTATWQRARAWALSISVMEVQHYRTSNSVLSAIAMRTIDEVLRDRGGTSS